MRMRLGRFAYAAFATVGLLVGTTAPSAAQLGISVGSSVYSDDHEFCLMSGAAVTHYQADYSGDVVGVSASYVNSDVPWPIPPGSTGGANAFVPAAALLAAQTQGPVYLSQGELIAAQVELFPLAALTRLTGASRAEGIGRIDAFLRPFIAAGLARLSDGDPAPAGDGRNAETYGIRGFTAPIVSYGARLHLPSRNSAVSLILQYKGTSLFVDEVEFETPAAEVVSGDGETFNWGTWSIGVSLGLGR